MPRNLNQDALENFFGQVRQHRGPMNCLSPKQFEELYKSIMVKHMSGGHSINSNCEETFQSSLFELKELLTPKQPPQAQQPPQLQQLEDIVNIENVNYEADIRDNNILNRNTNEETQVYVTEVLLTNILKKITCEFCQIYIFGPDFSECVNKICNISEYIIF